MSTPEPRGKITTHGTSKSKIDQLFIENVTFTVGSGNIDNDWEL